MTMDKDRLIGAAKQVLGSAKEVVGKIIGDSKLQVDGKAEQVEGKIQNALGGAKDALMDKQQEDVKQLAEDEAAKAVAKLPTPNPSQNA